MALIKLKKKPNNESKEETSRIKKLWKDPKSHALIVLGFYLVFFILIFIFLALNKPVNKTNNSDNNKALKEMFTKINENNNLTYNYIIKTKNATYLFNGGKEDIYIKGKLVTDKDNINITIENNICQINSFDEPELTPCPEDINYKYFDILNIYNLIKNKKSFKSLSNNYYEIKLDENDKVQVYYNDSNELSKILIKGNNEEYELTYKNI